MQMDLSEARARSFCRASLSSTCAYGGENEERHFIHSVDCVAAERRGIGKEKNVL